MEASGGFGEGQASGTRPWGVLLLVVGLLVAPAGLAMAQQLNALATSSFTSSRASQGGNAVHLDAYDEVLDANWNVVVSPVLSYRLGLRAAESDSRSLSGSSVTTSQSATLEPTLDVSLRGPTYTLSAGGRLRRQFLDGNKSERDEPGEMTLFTRLGWTPDGLPDVSLQYEHFKADDFRAPLTRDLDEDRVRVATRYSLQKLNLDYSMNLTLSDDRLAGRERTHWQHQGSLGYSESLFADWVSVSLFYQPNYTSSTERFAVPSFGTSPRSLSSAFSGLEPNPATTDPIGAPLNPAPQLLDGDLTTGVPLLVDQPIGPKLGNTSVGFEVLTGDPVDTIRVVANPGFDPTQAPALSFRVYQSGDRINWTEVLGVTQTFNQSQNRFELTISSTTARFFKVFVATNTSLVPIQAVELEALGPGMTTAGQKLTTSSLSQTLSGGLTLRPFAFSSLSYFVSVGDVRQDPGSRRSTNWSQTASLSATPHPLVTSTLSFTRAVSDSNQPGSLDTMNDSLSASASSSPLPTLTGSLSFAHTDAYRGGVKQTTSNGGGLSFTSQLYRNLNGDLSLTTSRSEDLVARTETTSYGTALNLTGTLTERLRATLGYTLGLTETSTQTGLRSSHSGNLNLTYAVSRVVSLGTRYDVANAGSSTTFTQQYRADWNPSARLSLFASYTRTDQFRPNQALATQNGAVTARWSLSRNFDLSLGYQYSRGITGDEQHTVSGSLSFRL